MRQNRQEEDISGEHSDTNMMEDERKEATHQKNPPLHVGFQFSYDLGDEPDEDDDEMNNTDGDEEGEEEQDDILIVEGDDEGLNEEGDETDSPNLRGKSMKKLRAVSNCSSAEREHKAATLNLTPASKALNVSQEEMST